MLSEKQAELIKKIQATQESLELAMSESLPKVFKDLANQVIELTNEISIDPKQRAKTLREIINLKTQISALVASNPAYIKQVDGLLEGFNDLKKLTDSYFSELIDGFNDKKDLYKEILKSNILVTKDKLLGAGIRSNFGNAITEVLKANTAGLSSRTQLQQVLRKFIEGTTEQKPYLERYITQTTNDALMVFNREYIQTISTDLNLQFYFYAGTRIKDTRPFCVARHGRYFKKTVVESWAKLGNWDGRMPGTTAQTIFSYCGGYNCRHELYPVSKIQYELAQKNGLAGIK